MSLHVRPVADERDGLLAFLGQQRRLIRTATTGLTDEQAAATPSASAFSLGAIVKHLAQVEQSWCQVLRRDSGAMTDEAAADDTTACVAEFDDLASPVPVPQGVPWLPQDVDAWSVRWVLLHLIEETARHAGHADLVRESLDGATWFQLVAAGAQR